MKGRYAPSPTGDLHVGNLRTALLAWRAAREACSEFLVRMEDLDAERVRQPYVGQQLRDLAAIGIDWDGEVVRQSERIGLYEHALHRLDTYECFCTRAEIRAAVSAPHGTIAPYPGTCRDLSEAERAERRRTRPPALRVRAGGETVSFFDRLHGEQSGAVDDFVVRRSDGAVAYNLAVVVDDADQEIEEVVRGDDLLDSTPRQVWLAQALGIPAPQSYLHVPLVFGPDGERLGKRHRSANLRDITPAAARAWIDASLADGLHEAVFVPD